MEKSVDAFRTISEVADDLDLPQHVLRFWETRFAQIRPLKRAGGRRYYRPADVVLLRSIRQLLYDEGYTIKGVQRLLKEKGPRGLREEGPLDVDPANFDEPEAVEGTHDVRRSFEDAAAYDPAPPVPHLASYDRILHEPSAREMLPHDVAPHDLHDARAVDFGPVETDRRPLDRAALSEILATIEDCQRLLIAVRLPRS